MEYIYINTRTVPPWRARIWAALQKLFGQKTEIVRITDSPTQPDVHDGSILSPDFDTLLQMLCVDSDSLKFNKRLRWIGDIEMNNGFLIRDCTEEPYDSPQKQEGDGGLVM